MAEKRAASSGRAWAVILGASRSWIWRERLSWDVHVGLAADKAVSVRTWEVGGGGTFECTPDTLEGRCLHHSSLKPVPLSFFGVGLPMLLFSNNYQHHFS